MTGQFLSNLSLKKNARGLCITLECKRANALGDVYFNSNILKERCNSLQIGGMKARKTTSNQTTVNMAATEAQGTQMRVISPLSKLAALLSQPRGHKLEQTMPAGVPRLVHATRASVAYLEDLHVTIKVGTHLSKNSPQPDPVAISRPPHRMMNVTLVAK